MNDGLHASGGSPAVGLKGSESPHLSDQSHREEPMSTERNEHHQYTNGQLITDSLGVKLDTDSLPTATVYSLTNQPHVHPQQLSPTVNETRLHGWQD